MIDINIKLENFEGPLALLYHLIEKNEIDIYDIPISQLTQQYLEIIAEFPPDMDSISSFIVMAATLLEIKSKLLLPVKKAEVDEDIDPREELVRKLLEYKRFKEISEILKTRSEETGNMVFKEAEKSLASLVAESAVLVDDILEGVPIDALMNAFLEAMNRKELKVDRMRSSFGAVVRDSFTVEEKMISLKRLIAKKKSISFKDAFTAHSTKSEIVVTFMALLELIKLRQIKITQKSTFGDIFIEDLPLKI